MGISGNQCHALVDTGADCTIVREDQLPNDINLHPVGQSVMFADNTHCANIKGRTVVTIVIDRFMKSVNVLMASRLCEPCLLGADVLWESRASVNISQVP